MSLTDLTLAQAAEGVVRGDFTAMELAEAALARIEAVNPKLNAFVRVEEETAREGAAAVDAKRARGERSGRSPARRSPTRTCITVRAGSRPAAAKSARTSPRSDLDGAGAAGRCRRHLSGGLNMAEFAMGPTGHNEHFGPCRNPWDTDRITGGSSSGSGSATAGRLCYGALGSDTAARSACLPASATSPA